MSNSSIGLWAKETQAAIAAAGAAVITALQDGHIENLEWVAIAAAFVVTFAGVAAIKNAASGPLYFAKAILAAVLAVLSALGSALGDGHVTDNEWVIIVLALLAAIPVGVTSNAQSSDLVTAARHSTGTYAD